MARSGPYQPPSGWLRPCRPDQFFLSTNQDRLRSWLITIGPKKTRSDLHRPSSGWSYPYHSDRAFANHWPEPVNLPRILESNDMLLGFIWRWTTNWIWCPLIQFMQIVGAISYIKRTVLRLSQIKRFLDYIWQIKIQMLLGRYYHRETSMVAFPAPTSYVLVLGWRLLILEISAVN